MKELRYRSNNRSPVHFLIVRVGFHKIPHNRQNLCIVLGTLANDAQKLVEHDHSVLEHMSIGVLECFLGWKWHSGNGRVLSSGYI